MYIVYIPFPDLYTYMRICMCWPEPGSDSAFIRSAFNVALPPFCRIICGTSSTGFFRDDVAGLRLPFDPLKNQIDRLCLLRVRKRHSSPYPPPLLHTAATATGGGMHRLEYRMSAHGSLPAVICRNRRRKFCPHKIRCVTLDSCHPHTLNIRPVRRRQPKATTKLRSPQPLKCFIKCHAADITKSRNLLHSKSRLLNIPKV